MQGLWRRADTHHELAIQSRGDRRNEHYLREETLMRRLIEGAALALDTVLPLSEGLSWMSRFDPHAEKPAATDDAEEARPQYGRSTANARVLGAVALGVTPLGDLGTHVPALEIGDPSFLDDVIRSFREGGGSLGGE
jgi:hypothetical protein